jgi:hypothetical protein
MEELDLHAPLSVPKMKLASDDALNFSQPNLLPTVSMPPQDISMANYTSNGGRCGLTSYHVQANGQCIISEVTSNSKISRHACYVVKVIPR